MGKAPAKIGSVSTKERRKSLDDLASALIREQRSWVRESHPPAAFGGMNLVVFPLSRLSVPLMRRAGDGHDKRRAGKENQGTSEDGC